MQIERNRGKKSKDAFHTFDNDVFIWSKILFIIIISIIKVTTFLKIISIYLLDYTRSMWSMKSIFSATRYESNKAAIRKTKDSVIMSETNDNRQFQQ